jgi:hypothetical protein
MKNKASCFFTVIISFIVAQSCVNLKAINDYSNQSASSIKKYDEIGYSFTQHCFDRCLLDNITTFQIRRETECPCDAFVAADSVTALIYHTISGYFQGMADLSKNELTTYNTDTLSKALTEGKFGSITIEKKDVAAYGGLGKTLLNAASNGYRRRKLKQYVEEANVPVQTLLGKLQFILQKNLREELDFKKEKLFDFYKTLSLDMSITRYDKTRAMEDYYQSLSEISKKQKQLDEFSKALGVIAAGHQKLYDHRNKMSAKEITGMLISYSSTIKNLMSGFNKLKN